MKEEKVDAFLAAKSKYFSEENIYAVREKLMAIDDSRYPVLMSLELKDPTIILVISILLGGLGVDRFMIGDMGMGVLKLLTGGVCGILTIIDWFTISKKVKEANYQKLISMV